jgi:hypothetical protein
MLWFVVVGFYASVGPLNALEALLAQTPLLRS